MHQREGDENNLLKESEREGGMVKHVSEGREVGGGKRKGGEGL